MDRIFGIKSAIFISMYSGNFSCKMNIDGMHRMSDL